MEEARTDVTTNLINQHVSYYVYRANKTITDYRCLTVRDSKCASAPETPTSSNLPVFPVTRQPQLACPFRVYISYDSQTDAFVVRNFTEHTCPLETHDNFRGPNTQRYLQQQLLAYV